MPTPFILKEWIDWKLRFQDISITRIYARKFDSKLVPARRVRCTSDTADNMVNWLLAMHLHFLGKRFILIQLVPGVSIAVV